MTFSIRVVHNGLDDLERDLMSMPEKAARAFAATTRRNGEEGTQMARNLAQAKAGPHGKAYFKRITGESTGPYSYEFGPEGDPRTDFVGVGFRHGTNRDLPTTADLLAPSWRRALLDDVDGLFW